MIFDEIGPGNLELFALFGAGLGSFPRWTRSSSSFDIVSSLKHEIVGRPPSSVATIFHLWPPLVEIKMDELK